LKKKKQLTATCRKHVEDYQLLQELTRSNEQKLKDKEDQLHQKQQTIQQLQSFEARTSSNEKELKDQLSKEKKLHLTYNSTLVKKIFLSK